MALLVGVLLGNDETKPIYFFDGAQQYQLKTCTRSPKILPFIGSGCESSGTELAALLNDLLVLFRSRRRGFRHVCPPSLTHSAALLLSKFNPSYTAKQHSTCSVYPRGAVDAEVVGGWWWGLVVTWRNGARARELLLLLFKVIHCPATRLCPPLLQQLERTICTPDTSLSNS